MKKAPEGAWWVWRSFLCPVDCAAGFAIGHGDWGGYEDVVDFFREFASCIGADGGADYGVHVAGCGCAIGVVDNHAHEVVIHFYLLCVCLICIYNIKLHEFSIVPNVIL